MVILHIFAGFICGFGAAVAGWAADCPFWMCFGLYSGGGSLGMVLSMLLILLAHGGPDDRGPAPVRPAPVRPARHPARPQTAHAPA